MLEGEQGFLHAIFLISKFNFLAINEVYVRIIIDKYQSFVSQKLMLISYSLNPVLVLIDFKIIFTKNKNQNDLKGQITPKKINFF
jgi:hypothetical protein